MTQNQGANVHFWNENYKSISLFQFIFQTQNLEKKNIFFIDRDIFTNLKTNELIDMKNWNLFL